MVQVSLKAYVLLRLENDLWRNQTEASVAAGLAEQEVDTISGACSALQAGI